MPFLQGINSEEIGSLHWLFFSISQRSTIINVTNRESIGWENGAEGKGEQIQKKDRYYEGKNSAIDYKQWQKIRINRIVEKKYWRL